MATIFPLSATVGANKVTTFTAGTGTVSWA